MTTLKVRHKVGDIVTNKGDLYQILACNDVFVTEVLILNSTRTYESEWSHATFEPMKPKLTHKEEICNKIKELEQKFKDRHEAKKKEATTVHDSTIIRDGIWDDLDRQVEIDNNPSPRRFYDREAAAASTYDWLHRYYTDSIANTNNRF